MRRRYWGQGSVSIVEFAKIARLRMDGMPPGVEPLLDAAATYPGRLDTYETHAGRRRGHWPSNTEITNAMLVVVYRLLKTPLRTE